MKRMTKGKILFAFGMTLLATSCGSDKRDDSIPPTEPVLSENAPQPEGDGREGNFCYFRDRGFERRTQQNGQWRHEASRETKLKHGGGGSLSSDHRRGVGSGDGNGGSSPSDRKVGRRGSSPQCPGRDAKGGSREGALLPSWSEKHHENGDFFLYEGNFNESYNERDGRGDYRAESSVHVSGAAEQVKSAHCGECAQELRRRQSTNPQEREEIETGVLHIKTEGEFLEILKNVAAENKRLLVIYLGEDTTQSDEQQAVVLLAHHMTHVENLIAIFVKDDGSESIEHLRRDVLEIGRAGGVQAVLCDWNDGIIDRTEILDGLNELLGRAAKRK